ncbi:MAG: creatininase family protein [Opitutaceae bacterium]
MNPRSLFLEELTSPEIAELITSGWKDVIVPLGATEQHGPGLPLLVDTAHGRETCRRAAARLGRVLVAPAVPFGYSPEHAHFPGTITVRKETIVGLVEDIASSLASAGFSFVYFWYGHGGDWACLHEAIASMKNRWPPCRIVGVADVAAYVAETWDSYPPSQGVPLTVSGSHAGEFEASIMLAIAPHLVRRDCLAQGSPEPLSLIADQMMREGMQSVSMNGVLGDQRAADAARGERYLEVLAQWLADDFNKQKGAPMPAEPLRLAFIGAGRVADVHHESVKALADRCRLVAVCDPRSEAREKRSREWNVPAYETFDELLDAERIDGACLFLPHHVHLSQVARAAERGVPVLLEKPLAAEMSEALAIKELVEKTGLTLLVGHNGLFHPAFVQAADFVRSGRLGRPLFGRGESAGWLAFRSWDFRKSRHETGGGCWIDVGGHLVYCLRELLGEVVDVTGFTANLARKEMEGEDHACVTLRYASGALAQLFVSYGHKLPGYELDWPHGYRNGLEVYGDAGSLRYSISPTPELSCFSEVTGVMAPEWRGWLTRTPAEPYSFSSQAELAHFLDCIERRAVPKVSAADACDVLKVLLRVYEVCRHD